MLTQFYPPIIGGEERHVKNLAAALSKRGHEVSIATLSNTADPSVSVEDGVKVYRLQGTLQKLAGLFSESERRHVPPFPDPGLVRGLRRVVTETRPEVVHAHNWLLHSFLPLKLWSGARLVVTLHDLSLVCAKKSMMNDGAVCSGPELLKCYHCAARHYGVAKGGVTATANWLSSLVERRLVDKFLTVSKAIAAGNKLQEYGVSYDVVPNFVPDDIATLSAEIDPRLSQLPSEPYMLFVGDLRPFKGTLVLLEAYQRLRNAPPLVMIGRKCPEMPDILPANIHIFESWPHAAVMHAWSRSLVGLVPSILPEACATVVMECMGMGKPLVATRIGGTPDLVEEGSTAILVPPGDANALADAMQRLIDDPELRQRMASAALARIHLLQAKTIVPRIEQIYSELLSKTHPAERPQRSYAVLH